MDDELDLIVDLNAEDDDGLGWATLADAPRPGLVVPGALLLAGNRLGQAVVRIVGVDDDGQVHFMILPGSVAKNRHLLDGNRDRAIELLSGLSPDRIAELGGTG